MERVVFAAEHNCYVLGTTGRSSGSLTGAVAGVRDGRRKDTTGYADYPGQDRTRSRFTVLSATLVRCAHVGAV